MIVQRLILSETLTMQKELFAAAPVAALSDSFSQTKTSFLDRHRLSLRLDQTLVVMIALLVVYVLIFSFGVETGKRYSMAELRAERAKRERMTEELSRKIFENQQNAQPSSGLAEVSGVVKAAASSGGAIASAVSAAPASAVLPPAVKAEESLLSIGSKPAGRYTIQTVTVASKATAEREIKKLAGKGHKAFVIPGGKKLQICVDGFDSRDEASRMLKQLKSQRLIPSDAYVRSIA